ncbi:MAG: hypothetical protein H6550_13915 [Chitinophagales bacterium]|nr:hypothetical protein [Chitinophagales bacterium]
MGKLILIVIFASIITAGLYNLVNRLSPFKAMKGEPTPAQKLLYYFIVLYVPVQLFILLIAGKYMPIANLKDHTIITTIFSLGHALLSIMGMVVSKYFYARNKAALFLLVLNASTAIFYFMATFIFITH